MSLTIHPNADGSGSIYLSGSEKVKFNTDGSINTFTGSGEQTVPFTDYSTLSGPCFSANMGTTSTSITGGTSVKIAYPNIDWDTDNCYDSGLSRFTPNVPGYYFIMAQLQYNSVSSITHLRIFKNGSHYVSGQYQGAAGVNQIKTVSMPLNLNGTTDYVEIYSYAGTSNATLTTNGASLRFSGFFIRGL